MKENTEKNQKENKEMEKIVSLCKRRGFIFPGSEIYGGLGGTDDWGHFGVALKNNIKHQKTHKISISKHRVCPKSKNLFIPKHRILSCLSYPNIYYL